MRVYASTTTAFSKTETPIKKFLPAQLLLLLIIYYYSVYSMEYSGGNTTANNIDAINND